MYCTPQLINVGGYSIHIFIFVKTIIKTISIVKKWLDIQLIIDKTIITLL